MVQAQRQIPLVQALRALAAFCVAMTHILYDALGMQPASGAVQAWYRAMPWGAGVDIFFVISGFVIVHSSRRLFAAPGAVQVFAVRRVARIIPLYWVMTTLFLAQLLLAPASIHESNGGIGFILKSYLFIPCMRPDGTVQPLLGLGWTLNYEMFFYLVFLPFLLFRRKLAVIGTVFLLAAFVLAGHAGLLHGVILRTWSDPIILEFCAGMLLAFLPGRFTLHALIRAAIVLGALILFHLQPAWPRVLAYGLPAAALVLAAIAGRPAASLPRLELWLVRLGDASYALYLVHPFVMRAAALLWRHLHQPGGIFAYIFACLAISQLVAIVIHYRFEKPVIQWLRRRLEPQRARSIIAPPVETPQRLLP